MTRRTASVAAFLVAVVAAWLNGLGLRWFAVGFQLLGESPDAGDFRYAAGAALATALMLLVALVVGRVAQLPWWLLVVTAVGVGTQVALCATALAESGQRGTESASVLERNFAGGFGAAFVAPGSWPLLVLLVVVVVLGVRGRSRRAAAPDRARG